MYITFNLFNLLKFLLYGAGIGALIYIVSILKNVNTMLRDVSDLASKNKNEIDRSLKSLPELSENLTGISKNINSITTSFDGTISNVSDNIAGASSYINYILELIDSFKSIIRR